MRLGGLSYSSGTKNRYRYNGKELHQEFNLGLYDYGARMYDPSIGRWTGVDPLADMYGEWSPFHYVLGNPVKLIDPTGMASDTLDVGKDGIADAGTLDEVEITAQRTKESEEESSKPTGTGRVATTFFGPRPSGSRGSGRIDTRAVQNMVQDPAMQGVLALSSGMLTATVIAIELSFGTGGLALPGKAFQSATRTFPTPALIVSKKAVDVAARGAGNLAKTPVGRSGNVMKVLTKNSSTTIGGRKFTGHALDQMQSRGILSPRAVLDVIKNPARTFPGNTPGTSVFIRDNLKVITNKAGDIITVIPQ